MKRLLQTAAIAASVMTVGSSFAADPIKIGHVYGKTGPLEVYALQLKRGLELGLEYATNGSNQVLGRDIQIIEKDTQLKPDRARALLAEAYGEDEVVLSIGPVSSGVAVASLPIAAEYEKIVLPQGVADSITGENWNEFVFRIGRNSSQDAIANAVAVGGDGVCVATIAQDYAFGRDGVQAYKEALEGTGGKVVHEEYAALDASDFTAPAQRMFDALKDNAACDKKYISGVWAGGNNPFPKIKDLQPERFGIEMTFGGNILPALVSYRLYPGLEGATYYFYEHPQNDVNSWLVTEHLKRYNEYPDFFTAQGMAQGMAIVTALEKAQSTDTYDLIEAMEGMEFDSPKGQLTIRAADHQTMQPMYHFKIEVRKAEWANGQEAGWPVLVREIAASEMDVPVRNGR